MSFQSRTSRTSYTNIDRDAESNKQPMEKCLTERPSSPLMFDDTISVVHSQLNRSCTFNNQVISGQKSQSSPPPVDWTCYSSMPINCGSGFSILRTNRMETSFLSMSQIERVTTCRLCDDFARLNESIDYQNRSITDVTLNSEDIDTTVNSEDIDTIDSVMRSSAKRARLNESSIETSNVLLTSDLTLPEIDDILTKLKDGTDAINEQLVSLHEDW